MRFYDNEIRNNCFTCSGDRRMITFKKYHVTLYKLLRQQGMARDVAIQLVSDYFTLQWLPYISEEDEEEIEEEAY